MSRTAIEAEATSGAVIYDFGMNNGDDVEYYLHKGVRVVGVEANPKLCEQVRQRFAADIEQGRLTVLNVALAEKDSAEPITFYVHKYNHVLSRLPEPPADMLDQFTPIEVACRTPASIVREHGEPLYVKIDVEHYDYEVLQNLFAAGIFPPEISAESHSVQIFACLVVNGYKAFSLVEGSTVGRDYRSATIATPQGQRQFRFREHSAGPFGEDIKAPWEDAQTFFHTLAIAGLGWKDIHASRVIAPSPPASSATIAARQAARLFRRSLLLLKTRTIGRFGRG
ncbi:MAG TPA: FkbM family methyltransferase [Sphingomicrobium sp.]|nr:FkbM family methyltransferase [Sphingomicrobium sp.]